MKEVSKPFITIGIASYNYARFLQRAFDAICRQSFTDYEVLYCDDGSTDDSVQVIRELIAQHPEKNIRLIEAPNQGLLANKNRILDNARGEYIMLCDADDWMEDHCLQVLAEAAKRTGADRVIAGFQHMVLQPDGSLQKGKVEYIPPNPTKWNQFQHHGCLYKSEVYRSNGIRFTQNPDDVFFVTRFNQCAKEVCFLQEVVYNFYIHKNSTSKAKDPQSEWYYLNIFTHIMELYRQIAPELSEQDKWQLQVMVLRIYFSNLSSSRSDAEYRQMKTLVRTSMPDYRKNPYMNTIRTAPFREDVLRQAEILFRADALGGLFWVQKLLRLKMWLYKT